jgi:KDO2-lipid IV(A) lauroyltransferase
VYFSEKRGGHRGVIRPPIAVPPRRAGKVREDVARVTQDVAVALEELIRVAPEQWHLFQPNWPSDLEDPTRRAAPP